MMVMFAQQCEKSRERQILYMIPQYVERKKYNRLYRWTEQKIRQILHDITVCGT